MQLSRIAAATVALACLALQPARAEGPGLADILAMIPAMPPAESGEIFSYSDFAAMAAAAGEERRPAMADNLDFILRSVMMPVGMREYFLQLDDMPRLLGFGWSDIDRALTFGDPPGTVTIVAGGPALSDEDALSTALGPRGFTRTTVTGVPVWAQGEDYAVNLPERQPGDPFGGTLGQSSRFAVLPGLLVRSAGWPQMRAVLAARAGKSGRLTDSLPGLQAAALAIEGLPDVDSPVIQAAAYLGSSFAGMGDPADSMGEDAWPRRDPNGPKLAPFAFAVLADAAAGDLVVNAIVLPYATAGEAQAATTVLEKRLAEWPRTAQAGAAVASRVTPPDADTPALAIAWVTYRPGPHGSPLVPGLQGWITALYRRELSLLSVP